MSTLASTPNSFPKLFGSFSGLSREPLEARAGSPLIVAIHGGTYTSQYFNIPGFSLLTLAAAAGIRVIAPDRNNYGTSPVLPDAKSTIAGSARSLAQGLSLAWRKYGDGCPGMVLIGHSIGGAVAAHIAADPRGLPVLGIAISGIGLRMPERNKSVRAALPETGLVDMPAATKDALMFGPPESYDLSAMPAASHAADALSPRAELGDVAAGWPQRAGFVLAAIRVPVHYRQGELDRLWIVDDEEVSEFKRALVNAPRVDAAVMQGTGHCMDFHRVGAALQMQQLGFALQCAVQNKNAGAPASPALFGAEPLIEPARSTEGAP